MRRVPPRSTVRACVALALGVLVAGAVATPEPIADGGVRAWVAHWTLPHCLTPNAGQALNELREAGRIAAALPAGWTLTGGEIESDAIVVEVADRDGERHRVTLALSRAGGPRPDAHGRTFVFLLGDAPPAARDPLLALATLIDGAIPDAALRPCSGHDADAGTDHATRRRSLLSAALQAAILVAAIVFGSAALPREVPGSGSV